MALGLRQNLVSAQYLEKKLTDFHQILYMHSYWQDLSWDCYTSFFTHLYQLWPLIYARICFRSISCEQIDRISPKFIYAFVLIRSSLRLLLITDRVMALDLCQNFVSTQYLESKWTEFDQTLYNHWYWQDLGSDCFSQICNTESVGPWLVRISFMLNILRTNRQNFTKFYICIDIDKI